jgi:hypothetical protein
MTVASRPRIARQGKIRAGGRKARQDARSTSLPLRRVVSEGIAASGIGYRHSCFGYLRFNSLLTFG